MEWASFQKQKKGAQQSPLGTRCFECAAVASQSYPHLSWDNIVAKAKTCKDYAIEFRDCKSIFRGVKSKTFIPAKMDEVTEIHGRCERSLWFLTESEFEERYKVKVSSCDQVSLVEIRGEQGQTLRGVFLQNPNRPFREFVFGHTSGMNVRKALMTEQDQLRQEQADDVSRWLAGERMQTYSAALKSVPSDAKLTQLIEAAKRREEKEAEELQKKKEDEAKAPLQQVQPLAATGTDAIMEEQESGVPEVVSKINTSYAAQFHAMAAQGGAVNSRGRGQKRPAGESRGAGRGAGEKELKRRQRGKAPGSSAPTLDRRELPSGCPDSSSMAAGSEAGRTSATKPLSAQAGKALTPKQTSTRTQS